MIYRIKLSIGYRDAYFDFTNGEDAISCVTTLIEHYKKPVDEDSILKVTIGVLYSDDTVKEDE